MKDLLLYPKPQYVFNTGELTSRNQELVYKLDAEFGSQQFEIVIKAGRTTLRFGKRGKALAESCYEQILVQCSSEIPCLEIRDEPKILRRGFMLDISRDRVPTRESLSKLLYWLWLYRYNELQLYTEHTFAYPGHELVWRDASPMTLQDYEWLNAECAAKGIELIPNQNTFGHFERWLKHPEYHQLAECPEGFEHPLGGFRKYGSVLRPNVDSLNFVSGLMDSFLKPFTSDRFNIGCDETWELGQGWSRSLVECEGRFAIYLKHVEKLIGLTESKGKFPQVWADILLSAENPLPDSLMQRIEPMIWGYEGDHPFYDQAKRVSKNCDRFYLVPGTSCWNSFSCRWPNAIENISNSVDVLRDYKNAGFLLTSWGDNGHHYPLSMILPALIFGGAKSWGDDRDADTVFLAIEKHLGKSSQMVSVLRDVLELDNHLGKHPLNKSLSWNGFFGSVDEIQKNQDTYRELMDMKTGDAIDSLAKRLSFCERLSEPCEFSKDLELVIEFLKMSHGRVRSILVGCEIPSTGVLEEKFVENWKKSSRMGGLVDSLRRIQEAF